MPDMPDRDSRISPTRIGIWVVVAGVGLYMLIAGLVGALSGGT